MPSDSKLPQEALNQTIVYLQQYLASEIELDDACRRARKLSRVAWFRQMLDELALYEEPDLVYASKDSPFHPQWAEAAVQRTILFLESGRCYDHGLKTWQHIGLRAAGLCFWFGISALITTAIAQDQLGDDSWGGKLFSTFAIALGILLAILFVYHAMGLLAGCLQIIRARVLPQNKTSRAKSDIWPYLHSKDYKLDATTAATRCALIRVGP